jgi:hypothetical protein
VAEYLQSEYAALKAATTHLRAMDPFVGELLDTVESLALLDAVSKGLDHANQAAGTVGSLPSPSKAVPHAKGGTRSGFPTVDAERDD